MNAQIIRVTGVALALLAALVIGTTYWQTWARPALADRQDNEIQRVTEFQIKRGLILTSGRLLARNREEQAAGRTLYFRRYPQGKVTAHVVGYSTAGRSRTGLERSLNDYLTGSNKSLGTIVDTSIDRLTGSTVQGNNVRLNIDLRAQKVALEQLGRTCGAVAALDPRTGAVKVLVSSPSFNPNLVEENFEKISAIGADCRPAAPLINRSTWGLYPPGSTFKVVTAAAALDSGRYEPDSSFYDPGYCTVYGRRVNNFDTSSPFGNLDLVTALRYSVNSVFCNIGKALGAKRILQQAKEFGFYERPPIETPLDERRASGLYKNGELWDPVRDADVDAGRMAFGQERMLVTPLQMAMVAGTIGNAGILMRPQVVERISTPNGRTLERFEPERTRRAVSPAAARDIAAMMTLAVEGGTGTAARIPGYRVGGKTGTAETGVAGQNVTWFIAFAGRPGLRPSVAIAVALERQSLTGGVTAAPIAAEVMKVLLGVS